MSGSIDAVNAQGISFQFDKFAQMAANAAKGTNVIRFIGAANADIVHEVFVFALADALREKTPHGQPFPLCHALMSRALSHFGKATELVYSGNLNRQTVIDTLFPDFKSIGVNAETTNYDIDVKVCDYVSFAKEYQTEFASENYESARAISTQGVQSKSMLNMSGASMQDCRRAAKNGKQIPHAPGMTDVTASLASASGFDDAGRNQFIGDIHRPTHPINPKTKAPLISDENNVFRFNIDGQVFTAKACDDSEKNNPQNTGIAKAVEKFCNKEIRPVQTNAVFFALSQGGLAPQMSLAKHGYQAADHGPITYTLSRNADTGDIAVKYENPVGSPLKFSWTATIDINGKTTATPVKIGK